MVHIPYRRELEFDYGTVTQLAPGIRRVIANNPGPFTFHGTGTYILGTAVAVIDPGPDDEAHIDAILAGLPGESQSYIGHAYPYGSFAGLPTLASQNRRAHLRLRSSWRRQNRAGSAG